MNDITSNEYLLKFHHLQVIFFVIENRMWTIWALSHVISCC